MSDGQQEECPQESQPWAFSSASPRCGQLELPIRPRMSSAPRPDTDAATPAAPPTASGPERTPPMGPVLVSLSLNMAAGAFLKFPGQTDITRAAPGVGPHICPAPPPYRSPDGTRAPPPGRGLADRGPRLPLLSPQGLHRDPGAGQPHSEQHGPDEQQRRGPGRQGAAGLPRAPPAPAGVRGAQWVAQPYPSLGLLPAPVLGPCRLGVLGRAWRARGKLSPAPRPAPQACRWSSTPSSRPCCRSSTSPCWCSSWWSSTPSSASSSSRARCTRPATSSALVRWGAGPQGGGGGGLCLSVPEGALESRWEALPTPPPLPPPSAK